MASTDLMEARKQTEAELVQFKGWRDLKVCDQPSYDLSGQRRLMLKQAMQFVHNKLDPICDSAHAHHKVCVGTRSELLAPLQSLDLYYQQSRNDFANEQERKRRAEEGRLRAELERQERERQQAEAAKLEAAAEAAAGRNDEHAFDSLAREAEAVRVAPIVAPPVVLAPAVQKTAGIATTKTWKAAVIDVAQLGRWALEPGHAERLVYVKIEPRLVELHRFARENGGKGVIPGVGFEEVSSEQVRG